MRCVVVACIVVENIAISIAKWVNCRNEVTVIETGGAQQIGPAEVLAATQQQIGAG